MYKIVIFVLFVWFLIARDFGGNRYGASVGEIPRGCWGMRLINATTPVESHHGSFHVCFYGSPLLYVSAWVRLTGALLLNENNEMNGLSDIGSRASGGLRRLTAPHKTKTTNLTVHLIYRQIGVHHGIQHGGLPANESNDFNGCLDTEAPIQRGAHLPMRSLPLSWYQRSAKPGGYAGIFTGAWMVLIPPCCHAEPHIP